MQMKPIVYITRKLPAEAVAPLRDQFEVRIWESESEAVPRTVLLEEAAKADALWTVITDTVDDELLAAAPQLKIVANMAVGYNNIDTAAAQERGVIVTNTPGVLTETTADLTFALLLATARRLGE